MINCSNIGILIPIRLASTRLPKKAILPLCGKPIIHHVLDRAFTSEYINNDNVIICTTSDSSDDELVDYVESYGARVFRGDPDDIIKRLYDAMVHHKFDYATQIDGDDITADPHYMDLCMSELINDSNLDVVSVSGLPLGIATRSFSFKAMKEIYNRYKSTENDTGFGAYFTETDFLNYKELRPISENHIFERVRLTLDYKEDFEFFNTIFNRLYKKGKIFSLSEIINLLKNEPEITEINYFLQEEYMNRFFDKRKIQYEGLNGEIITI